MLAVAEQLGYRPGGLREQLLVHDQVPTKDGVGLVSGDLHRNRLLDPGADEITDRRAPKVVEQPVLEACRSAGALPGPTQFPDGPTTPVEHARTQATLTAFPARDELALVSQQLFKACVVLERKDARL